MAASQGTTVRSLSATHSRTVTTAPAKEPEPDIRDDMGSADMLNVIGAGLDRHMAKLAEAVRQYHWITTADSRGDPALAEVKAILDGLSYDAGYLFRDACLFASRIKKRIGTRPGGQ